MSLGLPRSLKPLACTLVLSGCSVKSVPPRSRLVDRVDVIADAKARIDPDDVEKHLATRATSHFLPFELLSGVPVLSLLDSVTVEYNTFDRFVLQRDLERVRRYYRSRGFYDAEVVAGRVVTTDKAHVRVEIGVKEGEPVTIRAVVPPESLLSKAVAAGADSEALLAAGGAVQNLINAFENKPIEDPPRCADKSDPKCAARPRFDEERYEELKRAMQRVLTDSGFAYARVVGHADVDLLAHEVRITFSADPGPVCSFGEVRIAGNGEIPEALIRERLGVVKGQRYSTEKLDAAHDELAELGVFGSIELTADLSQGGEKEKEPAPPAAQQPKPPEQAKNEIPIQVNVQPIKLRALKLGVGGLIGSQLETHAIIGWEDRNLLGGLRTLGVEARPGLVFFPIHTPNFPAPRRVVPQAQLNVAFKQPSFPEKRTDLLINFGGKVSAPQIAPAPDSVIDPLPPHADSLDGYNIIGYYEVTGALGFERRFRFPRIDRSSVYLGTWIRAQLEFPFSYNPAQVPEKELNAFERDYKRVLIPYLDIAGSWDFRKDRAGKPTRTEPYRGVYTAFGAQIAFGHAPQTSDLIMAADLRLQPEVRLYKPVAERVVVAVRWTTGLLFPFNYGSPPDTCEGLRDEDNALCEDERSRVLSKNLQLVSFRGFYSGGPFSNRGYSFHEVGPHGVLPFASRRGQSTEQFVPTGGMGTWEVSGELRFLLQDKFSLVLFVDASDVVRTLKDFRLTYPHISPGTGLRVGTPVGPIRLDVGFRPPYLQKLGSKDLPPEEGGVQDGRPVPFPWAWSLAIGEAF